MKITKRQLKQIIKEELDIFQLIESLDEELPQEENYYDMWLAGPQRHRLRRKSHKMYELQVNKKAESQGNTKVR